MRIGRRSGPSSRDCSAASGVSPVPVGPGRRDRPSRAARVALAGLAAYRVLLSPFIGGTCRFTPSCSAYAEEAVMIHGAPRGTWLALRRLARCHPFGGWGYDPVPARDPAADG